MNSVLRGFAFVLSLSLPGFLIAQNLVPNPSFECGEEPCIWTIMSDLVSFERHACGWSLPSSGTSDVYSTTTLDSCWVYAPGNLDSDPYRFNMGTQMPRTGNRFAGFFAYGGVNISYREYMQTKLTDTLRQGETYCVEFYVSLADYLKYATNKLGVYFHSYDLNIHSYGFVNLPLKPHLESQEIILDSLGWTPVYFLYEPSYVYLEYPYTYMTIGNFNDDLNTDKIIRQGDPSREFYENSYYYIDDVLVERFSFKEFLVSGKTTICKGDSSVLKAEGGFRDITWTSLDDTLTILNHGETFLVKPHLTTSYRLKGRNCKYLVWDTVTVIVNPLPSVEIGNDTTLCAGDSFVVDAGNHSSYHWQNNSEDRFLTITDAGRYSVQVKNEFGCKAADEKNVSIKHPPNVYLGRDALICNSNFFPLKTKGGEDRYQWSTGITDSIYTPSAAGKYWVTVENQCGTASDTITIYALDDLFIPNVLTLNNDDTLNRYLVVKGIGSNLAGSISIYNRWGQPVYQNHSYRNNWPADPDSVPAETYYYALSYPHCPTRKGWVRVIK